METAPYGKPVQLRARFGTGGTIVYEHAQMVGFMWFAKDRNGYLRQLDGRNHLPFVPLGWRHIDT